MIPSGHTSPAKFSGTHVIIKLGTGVLTPHIGDPELAYFRKLARVVRDIRESGLHVLIVTSGAVGTGRLATGFSSTTATVTEKMAFASIGQPMLMQKYREAFAVYDITPAQILVSKEDFIRKKNYQNLRRTLEQLLIWGAVPIINENDAVSDKELKLGDNDTLSAHVAGIFQASLLLLLTTVDGFFIGDKLIEHVAEISPEITRHAGGASAGGTGGFITKLKAARIMMDAGQMMVIANGEDPEIPLHLLEGNGKGTWFIPQMSPRNARKRWLAGHRQPQGEIRVDSGAAAALRKSSASLLRVGVRELIGDFEKHDVVDITDLSGNLIARGFAGIASRAFHSSESVPKIIIHRDDLVILK